ncbi:MAG: hypothetical protein J6X35_12360 [Bacteroidales bacterium]|nr:hypothetical protein [Bacteroidales bacterium]
MRKQMLLLLLCGLAFAPDFCIAQSGMPEPPCIIYKTRKNYDANVAVGLSEDKSRIVSYPHPKDVFTRGELCTPLKVARRYRLDRRGIGPNTAFLSITYEEYSKLEKAPSIEELEAMIIDRNPFKKMYRCPISNPEQCLDELNKLIRKGCKSFEKLLP